MLVVIPPELLKEIQDVQEMRARNLALVTQDEYNLCIPKQRTIDEIRAHLTHIDQGHLVINANERRLHELWAQVDELQKAEEEKARRKPLNDRRKEVRRKISSLRAQFETVSPGDLPKIQQDLADAIRELGRLDEALRINIGGENAAAKGSDEMKDKGKPKKAKVKVEEGPKDKAKLREQSKKEREQARMVAKAKIQAKVTAKDGSSDDDDELGELGAEENDRKALMEFANLTPEDKITLISTDLFLTPDQLTNLKNR